MSRPWLSVGIVLLAACSLLLDVSPGIAGSPACDDQNPCTDDVPDGGGGCLHVNNELPCEDGDACTLYDYCSNGACIAGEPRACDDGDPCTDDACCPQTGCFVRFNLSACDDGDPCTTIDTCQAGRCFGGPPPDCDDGNPCTDDSCAPFSGCVHASNTAACDDGNACTTDETCQGGSCAQGVPRDCNDGFGCTVDACDPWIGCVGALDVFQCTGSGTCQGICSDSRGGTPRLGNRRYVRKIEPDAMGRR